MKSKTNITKCFLAKDVFATWKKLVASSQHSITIFTPYFDSTIRTLLKSCTLPKDRVKIITVFDPETLLHLIQQLKASKSLIEDDFKLWHLPGLHAKILISDQSKVVLGSQNFTRRGRRNKEASVVSPISLEGSRFMAQIQKWQAEATDIRIDLIEELLECLKPLEKPVHEIIKKASNLVAEKILEASKVDFVGNTLPDLQLIVETLDRLKTDQKVQFSTFSGYIWATLKQFYESKTFENYWALAADERFGNFQDWLVRDKKNHLVPMNFERLKFCLVMRKRDLRLVWGRLAKGRITYIRQSVRFDAFENLANFRLKLVVTFPREDTQKCNVIFQIVANEWTSSLSPLLSTNGGECEVRALFDGKTIHVLEAKFSDKKIGWDKQSFQDFKMKCVDLFSDAKRSDAFFFKALRGGFKFETLGIKKKNIPDFLNPELQKSFRVFAMQASDLRWLLVE